MKLSQVAAQLYTFREHLKTSADIARSLAKLRKIGYQTVETIELAVSDDELVRVLADEGIGCCAIHDSSANILNRPEFVVERLNKIGCSNVVLAWVNDMNWTSQTELDALIRKVDHAGDVFQKAGKIFAYHHHALEFGRLGKKTALEQIFSGIPASRLQAELDTYWFQYGGGDPAAFCHRFEGRLPLLHIKDYLFLAAENKPICTAIGAGNLDWPGIIKAADKAGTQWFIVEQDTTPGDPFDAARESFEFIRNNLVTA